MMANFKFKNKKSTDFELLMEPDFTLVGPEADITFEELDGVDGDYAIDNHRLKGVNRSIPVMLPTMTNKQLEKRAEEISSWLKLNPGWYDMEFSNNPDYIYRAMYHEEFALKKTLLEYAQIPLTFKFKPYKYYKSGMEEITLTNGQTLNNIGTRPAKPLIKLMGSGDMSITIGNKKMDFKAVDTGIIIDVLADTVSNLARTRAEWDKAYTYPFTKIPVGNNKVTWTGAQSVSIIPRWEALLP